MFRRLLIAAACLASVVPGLQPDASAAPPAGRVLHGHVPPVVRNGSAKMLGRAAADARLDFVIGLQLRNREALDQALTAASDPGSSTYGHYLSQAAANDLFNPTPDQEQQVTGWLHGRGLSVTGTYPNHLLVKVRGTVAQVSDLFKVTVDNYRATRHGKPVTFYSIANDPTVDASVSGVVDDVLGLDSYPAFDTSTFTNGTAHGQPSYYPQDFANAYDVSPLWNAGAGYTGAGQHVGVTLWEVPPSDTTLNAFGSHTGAAVATRANGRLNVVLTDGTASTTTDSGESAMDIEYSSGMAPGATIDYYEASDNTDSSLVTALNAAGTAVDADGRPLDRQISSSWGGPEWRCCTGTYENVLASNSATGHAYFFSSGDNGSASDDADCTARDPWPDYPASSAYVTSVGGTRLATNVGTSWPGETAWAYTPKATSGLQDGCANATPEGSGGGYSNVFSRPSWQTGVLGLTGTRGYPDVAAEGDPDTGAYVVSTAGTFQVGGTSLSSPLWAGMTALLNQYLRANNKGLAGFLNPTLYSLATGSTATSDFHDVTVGINGSYSAGSGWDPVSGWGSPDLAALVRDWPTSGDTTAPTVGFTSEPGADTNSTSASFGLDVADVDNTADQLTVTCALDGAAPTSCSAAALKTYTGLGAGPHTFALRASDPAGNARSGTYAWTVDTTAPAVQISAQPPSLTKDATATFAVVASDPDDTAGALSVSCTLDGRAVGCSGAQSGFGNGGHTFTAHATDPAGNTGTAGYTWTVDTTAPTVTLTTRPAAETSSTAASFAYSTSDPDSPGVSTSCSLDGASVGCAGPYAGLADGTHTLLVTASDAAGNTGADSFTWTVDTTVPALTMTTTPPALTNTSSATFAFTAADPDSPGVTSACALDGAVTGCGGQYNGLGTGRHTFAVTATDAAGNRASTSYTWSVDTVAPSATVKVGSGAPFTLGASTTLAWAGQDTGSQVAAYSVRWRAAPYDGRFGGWQQPASWQRTTATHGSLPLAAGSTYCFSVRATDTAGNTSPWTPSRCVSRPLDDASLHHSGGWSRTTGRAFYLHTLSTTKRRGTALSVTATGTDRIAVVASTCGSCGTVGVYVDGKLLKKVGLAAQHASNERLVVLPAVRLGRHTISLRSLTGGKSVKIDGLGMSAA